MIATRSATAAIAALSLVLLSACAPTTPATTSSTATPTPTATVADAASPTPTPTPDVPVAATVAVSASSIAVLDAASTVIVDIPFTTNGDAAADQLAAALGAVPVETVRAQAPCARAGTLYDFGGFVIDGPGGVTRAAEFTVLITSATTAGGVAVRGPGGIQIGASLADALAAIPGSVPPEEFDGVAVLTFEAISGAGTFDEAGIFGRFNGGSLVFIGGPVYVFGDC
jgi:hypothetical protein